MRMRLPSAALALASAVALASCGSSHSSSSSQTMSTPTSTNAGTTTTGTTVGFEGVALEQGAELGPASSTTGGATVDGIKCGAVEELAYHIHAHLAVYVNGSPRALPAGIGIPGAVVQQTQFGPVVGSGTCIYWLHTHTIDGIVHIESPTERIYTLGNFFDVWHQPLSATGVATAAGKVTAYYNGKRWTKSPRDIPLNPHAVIQLDVGSASPAPQPISFSGTQL